MADSTARAEPTAGSTQAERLAKAERLRAEGIDPYPFSFPDRNAIGEILGAHDPAELGEARTLTDYMGGERVTVGVAP